MATTTIKLDSRTRDALAGLKGNDTYDEVLEKLLRLVPAGDDEGAFKPEFRRALLEGLLYDGPRHSLSQVKAEFGL